MMMQCKLQPTNDNLKVTASCKECGFIATGTLIRFDEPNANGNVFPKDKLVAKDALNSFTDNNKCPFCRGMLERVEQ